MPVYNGSTKQKDLYYGSSKIKEVYYGDTKVYVSEPLARCYRSNNENGYIYVLKGQAYGTAVYINSNGFATLATSVSQLTNSATARVIVSYDETTLVYRPTMGADRTGTRYRSGDLYS